MKKLALLTVLLACVIFTQAQVKGVEVEATGYIIIQGDTMRLDNPIDGEVLKRINGVWTNGTGGAGSASVDSLFRYADGRIGWYIGGSIAGDIAKDSTNVAVSDTLSGGAYYSQYQVEALILALADNPFALEMPTGTSVQERINGMVEGTDYPTGWVLTADGLNLIITHNLGRNLADVTVWANISGDTFNKLEGTSAHATGGLYSYNSANESAVFSLATIQKPINVYLFFAQ